MKKYRIDKDKNIGNVIFVVEGGRPATGGTELRLLKKYLLIYLIMKSRSCEEALMNLSGMEIIPSSVYLR